MVIGKPDALIRLAGNEKSGAKERIFASGQLISLEENEAKDNENEVEDIEVDGIDCAEWDRNEGGLLKVPENHINDMLRQCHDSKVAGYWGRTRIQELVSRNFTWDNWKKDVMNYVAIFQKCQKSKSDRHARQTKTIPNQPLEEIAMDFIVELPESEGYNVNIESQQLYLGICPMAS